MQEARAEGRGLAEKASQGPCSLPSGFFLLMFYLFGCIGSQLLHVGYSCGGWLLQLRHMGSAAVALGLRCPTACGILVL